ncbi:hypothetical protein D9599_21325 [Roseomonas sp. KE2513]|nr:hypothetical protein [Roseomonas sp. KE2513]
MQDDAVLEKILADFLHYYVDEHGQETGDEPINWTWARNWPKLGRVVLTALHQLCTSKRELRFYKSALGLQQHAKPFFVWLRAFDPAGEIGNTRELSPEVFQAFKEYQDDRVATEQVRSKTAYQYKGAICRLLKQAWYSEMAGHVLGSDWEERHFVADGFEDDNKQRPPYSMDEANRVVRACSDLLLERVSAPWSKISELAAYTGIGLRLGIETECIDRLRVGDVQLLGDRRKVKVTYIKRRTSSVPNRRKLADAGLAEGVDDSETVDQIEDVGPFTTGGGLLLYAQKRAKERGASLDGSIWSRRFVANDFDAFSDLLYERGLRDDKGDLLQILRTRFRVTYKQSRMIKSGGNLSLVADDHTKDVASSHYLEGSPHLQPFYEHAIITAQTEALEYALNRPKPAVIALSVEASEAEVAAAAAETGLPPQEVRQALSGETDVWLASCRGFYSSPFSPAGQPCSKAFWGCLGCVNGLVTRRTLPRVLQFLSHITEQRRLLGSADWQAKFGVAYVQIIRDVLPKFPRNAVEEAKHIAEGMDGALHLPPELLSA